MATVPVYDQLLVPAPGPQKSSINVQASPESFGAATARGMEGLAQGLGQASNVFALRDQYISETMAKDNATASDYESRDAVAGYLQSQGLNAINGEKDIRSKLQEIQGRHAAGLTGRALDNYNRMTGMMMDRRLTEVLNHKGQQTKAYANTQSDARVQNFLQEALTAPSDYAHINTMQAAGEKEIRQHSAEIGLPKEATDGLVSSYVSSLHSNVVMTQAVNDPETALAYAQAHSKEIGPQVMGKLMTELRVGVTGAKASTWEAEHPRETYPGNSIANAQPLSPDGKPAYVPSNISPLLDQLEHKYRIPAGYLGPTGQVETGWQTGRVSSTGAKGVFQFVGSTLKQYPHNPNDVAANAEAAAHLAADNMRAMSPLLGRDPTARELYLGHNQGSAGASALLTAGPSTSAVDALISAGVSPSRAVQAIIVNGGSTGMTADEFAQRMMGKFDRAAGQSYHLSTSNVDRQRQIDQIQDPYVRTEVMHRELEMQQAMQRDAQANKQAADAALWEAFNNGKDPNSVPVEQRVLAGATTESVWNAVHNRDLHTNDVPTDWPLFTELKKLQGSEEGRQQFADMNLLDYRDRLATPQYTDLVNEQLAVRKDAEAGTTLGAKYNAIFAISNKAMEAAGIGIADPGVVGSTKQARIEQSKFQVQMMAAYDDWVKNHPHEKIKPSDVVAIANSLAFPLTKQPGTYFGDDTMYGYQIPELKTGESFGPGQTVKDLPAIFVADLRSKMTIELGRPPTDPEIEQRAMQIGLHVPQKLEPIVVTRPNTLGPIPSRLMTPGGKSIPEKGANAPVFPTPPPPQVHVGRGGTADQPVNPPKVKEPAGPPIPFKPEKVGRGGMTTEPVKPPKMPVGRGGR